MSEKESWLNHLTIVFSLKLWKRNMVFILMSEKDPSQEGGKHSPHKQHPNIPQSDSSEEITDKVIRIENKLRYTYLIITQGQSSGVECTATNIKANTCYQQIVIP